MRVDLVDPSEADLTRSVTRLLEGQNKSELARLLDVSRETLYRWERGESIPSVAELLRLAQVTDNEVRLVLNPREVDLDQQIRELRESLGLSVASQEELLSIIEGIEPRDADTRHALQRIRDRLRRIPPP